MNPYHDRLGRFASRTAAARRGRARMQATHTPKFTGGNVHVRIDATGTPAYSMHMKGGGLKKLTGEWRRAGSQGAIGPKRKGLRAMAAVKHGFRGRRAA